MEIVIGSGKSPYYYVAVYSSLGFVMVVFTFLCLYAGLYLDRKFGTGYNFSLIMTIAGMVAGAMWTYARILRITMNNGKRDSKVREDDIGSFKEK
ncbi:MAG: AtpZ/AtpI family protein [Firmicutes bacterium]|nr:AtpZ/AtpI family protein [Bacillota bacterium]